MSIVSGVLRTGGKGAARRKMEDGERALRSWSWPLVVVMKSRSQAVAKATSSTRARKIFFMVYLNEQIVMRRGMATSSERSVYDRAEYSRLVAKLTSNRKVPLQNVRRVMRGVGAKRKC